MKVMVIASIRDGKKYPFVQPVWLDTRLKPGVVPLKGAEGKRVEAKRGDAHILSRSQYPRSSLSQDRAVVKYATNGGCMIATD
jgi:hypothetical protein